jgi:molecular chaperone DnaK
MTALWTSEARLRRWRDVELAALAGLVAEGMAPKEALAVCEAKAGDFSADDVAKIDEIEQQMVGDAESHAEEDRIARELAEARNKAEALCFQTEKLVKENAEKLSASDKAPLEAAIAKAREVAKGEDVDAITSAHDSLEQASHALSKVLYEAQAARGGQPGEAPAAGAAKGGDDAIDAEFEVK